jgi:hypothetical protein
MSDIILNFHFATDLIISAEWIVDIKRAEKPAESWLYILPNPTEEGLRECDQWLNNPYVVYCAYCFETNKKGDTVFILYLILNARRKYEYMTGRCHIGGGLIMSKKAYQPSNKSVVDWMKGPWKEAGVKKEENETFHEMRRSEYSMGGRGKDKAFLECENNWIDCFLLPELKEKGEEERPKAPPMKIGHETDIMYRLSRIRLSDAQTGMHCEPVLDLLWIMGPDGRPLSVQPIDYQQYQMEEAVGGVREGEEKGE